jgi:aryl carrier-like protein
MQERLPEHMLPSVFVVLGELPLTPHGKIDRRALPPPEQVRPELAEAYVAPRTAVEEVLAETWAQVLEVERVGIHDSFFELGGDSILSIRLIARSRQKGIEFSARQLFQHPTIAELVDVLQKTDSGNRSTKEPVLAAAAQNRAAPASELTPTEFQDADVNQRELDNLIAQITRTPN